SYTLIIEGQGGTVGSVKSIAKVSLGDDSGITVLSYDVDAQVNGRLAQLGGPIMDATAKQLAARFFGQFGKVIAPPETAAGAAVAGTASRGAAGGTGGSPIAWMLAVVVAALVGYLVGRSTGVEGGTDWMGIAIGLLLLIVGYAGFVSGRRSGSAVVTLDAALLARLLGEDKR
ncbi:MAG: CoxG family protein, partial [Panacagrimonas sp.]